MKIAIIGCGNMGAGIAPRLSVDHDLKLYDRKEKLTQDLAKQVKGKAFKSSAEAAKEADLIILAVKPKDLKKAAIELKKIRPSQILISLLAGTPTAILKQAFGNIHLLRMMPNVAVLHGQGVIALAETDTISSKQKSELTNTFAVLGTVHWIPEEMFDAVTSLTASGPAFAFILIESMIDAAIAMGFTAEQGRELVLQMLAGSLSMIKETGKHPGDLKWQVTSPGGMTIAGIAKLEESNIRSGIMQTFLAAFQKAKRLKEE